MTTMQSATKMDYRTFMTQVNAILSDRLGGLDSNDLPDCPTYDWFVDGVTPKSAATRIIRNAKSEE